MRVRVQAAAQVGTDVKREGAIIEAVRRRVGEGRRCTSSARGRRSGWRGGSRQAAAKVAEERGDGEADAGHEEGEGEGKRARSLEEKLGGVAGVGETRQGVAGVCASRREVVGAQSGPAQRASSDVELGVGDSGREEGCDAHHRDGGESGFRPLVVGGEGQGEAPDLATGGMKVGGEGGGDGDVKEGGGEPGSREAG